MTFQPFEPFLPCADGSPAGVYSSNRNSNPSPRLDERKHVIVFEGGTGACTSPEHCVEGYKTEPYKFSSLFLPEEIEGHTILSEDSAVKNPLQNYSKWLVPYCTQDLFLGDIKKGEMGELDLIASGSAIVRAVLSHWQQEVQNMDVEADSLKDGVEQLVIVGVSAGAIGVLNHIQTIRETANATRVASVLYILDSSTISDQWDDNSNFTDTYVDFSEHPLCDTTNAIAELYDEVSDLPCCLSTHCMLRHDDSLFKFRKTSGDQDIEGDRSTMMSEEMLLFDSNYDPLAIFANMAIEKNETGLVNIMQNMWNVAELAGSRKSRPLETSAYLGPNVHWFISSCFTHGFLVPSVALLHVRCQHDDVRGADYNYVCSSNGLGVQAEVALASMKVTLWQTKDTWQLAMMQGRAIRDIISAFVTRADPDGDSSSYHTSVEIDGSCYGPNCGLTAGNPPPCQSLIELERTFFPVPAYMQVLWFCAFAVIIATAGLRLGCVLGRAKIERPDTSRKSQLIRRKSLVLLPQREIKSVVCSIRGLSISIEGSGTPLVNNVSLRLNRGEVVGLMGRSGAGKSVLLSALSQHCQRGLVVSFSQSNDGADLSRIQKGYLRQSDQVKMENMVASEYLHLSALIHGADPERFNSCYSFIENLFARSRRVLSEEDEEAGEECDGTVALLSEEEDKTQASRFDPFNHAKIKSLSGGQRRILAMATQFLTAPSLVLLDEPLSGLDSASSEQVMDFVHFLAQKQCTILITIHQPSNKILSCLDSVVILDSGNIILNERMEALASRAQLSTDLERLLSELFARSTKRATTNKRHSLLLLPSSRAPSTRRTIVNTVGEDASPDDDLGTNNDDSTPKNDFSKGRAAYTYVKEYVALCRRLYCNYGMDWPDMISLPIVFSLFAWVLSFDNGSFVQEVIVTSFYISLPLNMFRHKVHLSCEMWRDHLFELDDRKISLVTYQLATQSFTFAIPILSLCISLIIGYSILGWSFKMLPVLLLFSTVHLLVGLQIGRTLCVYFRGEYRKFSKYFAIILFLNFIFGGMLVSVEKLPAGLSWMYALSFTFWAISGATLNQLQFRDSEAYCLDALTCIISDGSFLSRYLGFAPTSNCYLALIVLTIWFVGWMILEYILLCYQCAGLPKPKLPSCAELMCCKKMSGQNPSN